MKHSFKLETIRQYTYVFKCKFCEVRITVAKYAFRNRLVGLPTLQLIENVRQIPCWRKNPEECSTCNGITRNSSGKLIKTRSTIGLVCPDCGHNYGKDSDDGEIGTGVGTL